MLFLFNGEYQESATSPIFPDYPIVEMNPRLVEQACQTGTSTMLRQLRNELSQKYS